MAADAAFSLLPGPRTCLGDRGELAESQVAAGLRRLGEGASDGEGLRPARTWPD